MEIAVKPLAQLALYALNTIQSTAVDPRERRRAADTLITLAAVDVLDDLVRDWGHRQRPAWWDTDNHRVDREFLRASATAGYPPPVDAGDGVAW